MVNKERKFQAQVEYAGNFSSVLNQSSGCRPSAHVPAPVQFRPVQSVQSPVLVLSPVLCHGKFGARMGKSPVQFFVPQQNPPHAPQAQSINRRMRSFAILCIINFQLSTCRSQLSIQFVPVFNIKWTRQATPLALGCGTDSPRKH